MGFAMSSEVFSEILNGLYENKVVPYLGPGVLFDATNKLTGAAMPASSNSLILAMNNGNPMAPKLMYEFPRAAMNQELKKGRNFRLCLILTFTVELDKKSTHESTKYDRRVPQPWRVSVSPTHQFRL